MSTTSPPTLDEPASAPPLHIPSLCITDTGCTGHYIHITTPHLNRTLANPGISVLLPDGNTIHSTHTATLDLPHLPPAARIAHIFPTLSSGSLLSIGLLCDHGCTATFNPHTVDITLDGATILTGTRSPTTNLWTVDLSRLRPQESPIFLSHHQPPHRINALLASDATIARRVAFYHAALFSPSISTWCAALDRGHLTTWPDLTAKQVRRHPPASIPMIKGHLDQQRANLQSTKTNNDKYANNASATTTPAPPTPATDTDNPATTPANLVELEELDDFHPPAISPPAQRTYHIYADYASTTGKVFTDQTGRFLQPSSNGNSDMLVFYEYDSNYIHVEPMKNKTGSEILAAYTRAHTVFTSDGLKPQLQRLDNEASTALKSYMESQDVDFQLVPPHVHRRNAAERAIRTFKNHFVAGLCSTDRNFPLHLWDRLLPQALLSLNLLRSSCINPNLSAWAKVHGTFDFNRTPLAPPGTRVLIHEPSTVRETWAPHAVEGWYIGPALQHYRCYTIWADATSAERIANTLTWFPSQVEMPTTSPLELATAAAQDLVAALLHPSDASPLPSADLVQRAALQQLADIFATITNANPTRPTPAPTANTDAPPALVPRVEAETPAPTPTPPPPANPPATAQPAPIPRVPISDTVTYHTKTRNPGQRRRQARKAAAQLGLPVSPSPRVPPPAPPPPPAPAANSPNPHVTRSRSGNLHRANCVVATADLPPDPQLLIVDTIPDTTPVTRTLRYADDTVVTHHAYAVIDPATGASLEYPALLRGPDSTKWEHGTSLEIGRLTQGCLPYTTKASETMFFIRHTEKPADRIATYLRIVAALKLNKAEMYRIRFTVGGDRIVYHGKVSTPTADLTTVKTHLNSVLSTPDAKYMTIDIKDFYLNTPMDQYMTCGFPPSSSPPTS